MSTIGGDVGSRTLIQRWANQSLTFRNGTRPHVEGIV
jgi:hypothetical protein